MNREDLSVLNDSILTVPYTQEADAFYLEDETGSKTYAAQTDSVTMTASFLLPHTGTWTFYSETDGVTDATQEIAVVSASAGNKSCSASPTAGSLHKQLHKPSELPLHSPFRWNLHRYNKDDISFLSDLQVSVPPSLLHGTCRRTRSGSPSSLRSGN